MNDMQKQCVYAFEYCYCVHESSPEVISLHVTKRGAYKAMMKHKWSEWDRYRDSENYFKREDRRMPGAGFSFGGMERWSIRAIEIQNN